MKKINHSVMIRNFTLIIIAFLLGLSGCMRWDYNKVVHGIEFSKIRYETMNNDTLAIIGYLAANKVIEEYPCAEDWIHFTKDWQLKLFRISEKSVINNFNYPKNTWIKFNNEHNVICVFPNNTYIQSYLCKGGGGAKGISTLFYKSGKLHCFYSENNVLIGKINCLGGVFNNIELFENGNLKECTLASDKEIDGIQYKKYARLSFDGDGKVRTSYN